MIDFKQWNIDVVPSKRRRVPSWNYIGLIITWTFVFKDFVETTLFPIPAALL